MRRLAVASLTAGLALTFVPAASAYPPNAVDRGCTAATFSDRLPESPPDAQTGALWGGPIRQNGTLTCTIKVTGSTHDASVVHGASLDATGTGGVTMLRGVASLIVPRGEPVYLCSQFHDGISTFYWDGNADAWTTNRSVSCERMSRIMPSVNTTAKQAVIDPIVCPVFATLHPFFYPSDPVYANAEGDLFLLGGRVWDCPPYTPDSSGPYVEGYYYVDAAPVL
ncbi:MAG TPA: hypothetical protein VNQ77_00870 [Frankiaceae bacterium]|nr:hypothetical protein [Frankiaceae bacterium]